MDQSVSGYTFYRNVSSSTQIDNEIRKYFSYSASDFTTRWALIATWYQVGYFNRHADKASINYNVTLIRWYVINLGEHFSSSCGY